ncbi:hypothetical protein A4G20_09570 [Pasteurellaceae bacterium RH1A]|nr:hypothetical protein A4G20_09570 [Pasteurellaceae bacterium RH1A]
MKNRQTQNIVEVLQNSSLSRVVEKANQLNEIAQKIAQNLPQNYRGLYRIANLVDNQLVFEVQNGTVKQGFLLQEQVLLNLISQDFPHIHALVFKVNPSFSSLTRGR